MRVDQYLAGSEELTPKELVWGVLHQPPAPRFGHQSVVGRVFVILDAHARAGDLGVACVSPIDVVLDEARALVVQPDVVFVSKDRRHIIRDQVWGAPDLVVEVASRRTAIRDRTTKLAWYRKYGVRECWLIDPVRRLVVVANLGTLGRSAFRFYSGTARVRSTVLPAIDIPAVEFFN